MLPFFRKIRKDLIGNIQIIKYLKYAVGEIVLVVVGILIAISINNQKDASDRKDDEIELYKDIITELSEDLKDIRENAQHNDFYLNRYRKATEIIISDKNREKKDTLATIATELTQFSDFKNERPIYDRLFTSGEQNLISDTQILTDLKGLAISYNYTHRLERNQQDFMYAVVPKIADYIRFNPPQIMDLDGLYSYRFQNDIEVLIFIMEEKKVLYANVEDQLNDILSKLEAKLE